MKINKKIRNWILGIIAGLTIVGTAADLPFGIRAFRRLEDRTFVGLNVGLINSIDMSNVYGASIGVGNGLNDESNVYGASIGVGNDLNESNVYGASIGVGNGLDNESNVYGASIGVGYNGLNNESNVYGASIGVVNSLIESNVYGASIGGGYNGLDSKSNVYGLSGILNFKIGEGANNDSQ